MVLFECDSQPFWVYCYYYREQAQGQEKVDGFEDLDDDRGGAAVQVVDVQDDALQAGRAVGPALPLPPLAGNDGVDAFEVFTDVADQASVRTVCAFAIGEMRGETCERAEFLKFRSFGIPARLLRLDLLPDLALFLLKVLFLDGHQLPCRFGRRGEVLAQHFGGPNNSCYGSGDDEAGLVPCPDHGCSDDHKPDACQHHWPPLRLGDYLLALDNGESSGVLAHAAP